MDLLDYEQHADREISQELDWDGMLERCKKKDEKLNLAGEYGLKLHEQLLESQTHMDEMRLQHEAQVEKMIQEIYELKSKLEKMEKDTEDEKQAFKRSIDECHKTKERVQNESNQEINLLKKTKISALAELDQVLLRERQLNDTIIQLEEKNAHLMAEKQKKREIQNISYSEEIFCLHESIANLQEEVETCNNELNKFRNKNEILTLALKTKTDELNNKQHELEEAEKRSTVYFNHLQKSREETKEVLSELDALKMQRKQAGHLKVGNSLFGEVEDERLVMEKKLKTMEIKCESQQKAYSFLKSQHFNLKSQVTALLSLHTGKADSDHIDNLERALSQVKAENTQLVNKLKSIKVNENENIGGIKQLATLPQFEGNKDMVEFLLIKLENSNAEIKKLSEELDCIHMIKMAESDKLLTAEEKLHDIGVIAEKYKNENMKLRLRLEETKNKLEAEKQKRILIEKKFNYDSTNDAELIGVSSDGLKTKSALPYTLTKAKCKPVKRSNEYGHGNKFDSNDIFSSKVNWDDVLKKLGQKVDTEKKNNVNTGLNKNIFPNEERTRKVSFKNVDEILPLQHKQNDNAVREISSLDEANRNELKETKSLKELGQKVDMDNNINVNNGLNKNIFPNEEKCIQKPQILNKGGFKESEKFITKDRKVNFRDVDEVLPFPNKKNDNVVEEVSSLVEVNKNEVVETKRSVQILSDKPNDMESDKENCDKTSSCVKKSNSVKSVFHLKDSDGKDKSMNQTTLNDEDIPCNVQ